MTGYAKKWWRDYLLTRPAGSPGFTLDQFSELFIEKFLPITLREERRRQFERLQEGEITVTQYAPSIVATMRDRIHMFIAGLALELIEACATAALQNSMDISRIQEFAQNIKRDRRRQQGTERTESWQRKRIRFARSQEQS
ncbi:uncharacterized protein [Nicotiana tomentosiformis]|uniref:uncharacterized protein n=1 Tax=Nicotiana tomentosiformis TaxID=4098 RepID=UPI00388C78C5